ncbi:RagB/SusD family nutrient uptake outer membrane protein [Capnocytophaga bilenii]|jgi:putative ragB/susD domain protein
MKKILYITSLLLVISVLPTACARLDLEPYNEVDESKTFNSKRDAELWVNGMYNALRDANQGKQMYASDVQADYLNAAQGMEKVPNMHRWSLFNTSEETTATIWKERFLIIQDINIALKGFPKIPEQNEIKGLTGALYLGRAYCYTYLVTHFCKPYKAATAATDLGLPILTDTTLKNFPPRSSVKDTYAFILSDIAQAETLLASETGEEGADTFTIDAVKALKARVLLYQNDWAQAYQVAEQLIATGHYPLASSATAFGKIWTEDSNTENITQLYAAISAGVSEVSNNTNDLYLSEQESFFIPGQIEASPNVLPTQDFVDLFEADDWRKDVFLKSVDIGFFSLYAVNKYPRNEKLELANSVFFYYGHKAKLFRIAETYLIAAEAAFKNNDETNAKRYLNLLRVARGLAAVTTTGNDLFTDIQNERSRELCFEDFRLYDLSRWGLPVKRGTPQDLSSIRSTPAEDYNELNIQVGSAYYHKIVWPIPADDIDYERGKWKQNPGW